MSARSPFEHALMHERWLVLPSLALVTAACWAWIVPMARDMYGPMTGPAAWMMTPSWDGAHVLLLFAMWGAMMLGMMLPSAAPTLLIYGMVVRRSDAARDATLRVHLLGAGYIVVWTGFAALATLLQRWLATTGGLTPMMTVSGTALGAAVLLIAGLYQLTPLKHTCLNACVSPAGFIARHWRPGRAGAFQLGLRHGAHCLGCCWALMLLLFVGGVMNLTVIVGLTIFLLAERLLPPAWHSARVTGGLLIGFGLWIVVRQFVAAGL
jgi:predicted metal-binding membrane protein